MGFQSDYEEIVSAFGKVGLLNKLFIGISFFLTVSSVTSLSEGIFKWKGFILDAINMYQYYIVVPLKTATAQIGLSYQDYEIHSAIILSTVIVLGMRLLMLGQQVAYDKINEEHGSKVKPNLLFFRVVAISFPLLLWLSYGITDLVFDIWPHIVLALIYPIVLVGPKEIMCRLSGSNDGYLEKSSFSYFKVYYSYLLAVFLLVGVLGAINAGLTKIA